MDAFLAAARGGDFDALLAVLDPNVVVRADRGAVPAGASRELRGRGPSPSRRSLSRGLAHSARVALVNGAAGIVSWLPNGQPFSVMGFTVRRQRIVEIDILADPARLRALDLTGVFEIRRT